LIAIMQLTGKHYVRSWLALLALTALSFALSRVHLGHFGPTLALAIASGKALIVALVFMHLYEGRFMTQLIPVIVVAFVAILCLGLASDVAAR
jgi:cytochrome c oxidase subunit IV